jgi:hypothetical protein
MPIINGGKVIINITGAPGAYPDVNHNDIPDKAESLDDGLGNTITAAEIKDHILNDHDLEDGVDGGDFV